VQAEIDAQYKRQKNKEKGERGKKDYVDNRHDPREAERLAIKAAQDKFKNYVPDVKLEYKDESGRHLTPKEVR
jgi:SART-1 family